jgi:HK97 family phage major capsid protein
MALTLTEASKLSQDMLVAGVIETMAKESAVLQYLPFIEITGNGLTYNREDTPPTAAFYDVGDAWAEDTPTFEQVTAVLRILGGDADVDNFLKTTRSNVQDLEAAVVELKARAVREKFEDTFINGDTSSDESAFDGIRTLATQSISSGINGEVLSLDKLDELIDTVRGGKPDLLLMSGRTRRSLNELARTSGTFLEADRDGFGGIVQFYDGIPIGLSDYIADDETVGTSSDCSSVYALRLGEGGLAGLTAPGGLTVERVGSLETKDASRIRVKWYVGLALFSTLAIARLTGIRA